MFLLWNDWTASERWTFRKDAKRQLEFLRHIIFPAAFVTSPSAVSLSLIVPQWLFDAYVPFEKSLWVFGEYMVADKCYSTLMGVLNFKSVITEQVDLWGRKKKTTLRWKEMCQVDIVKKKKKCFVGGWCIAWLAYTRFVGMEKCDIYALVVMSSGKIHPVLRLVIMVAAPMMSY